jgi:hypothetical protein
MHTRGSVGRGTQWRSGKSKGQCVPVEGHEAGLGVNGVEKTREVAVAHDHLGVACNHFVVQLCTFFFPLEPDRAHHLAQSVCRARAPYHVDEAVAAPASSVGNDHLHARVFEHRHHVVGSLCSGVGWLRGFGGGGEDEDEDIAKREKERRRDVCVRWSVPAK